MSARPIIRVLTVDDHPLLRSGIAAVLEGEEDIMVVGEATNGGERRRTCFDTIYACLGSTLRARRILERC
jgi:hypothetical protein